MHGSNFKLRQREYINKEQINSYLSRLSKKIKVEALIVFGSRARSEALLTSDYDICVISDDFTKMSRFERTFLLLDSWEADTALEPVAYTTEEFKKATGLLVWDILEDGVVFKDTGVFKQKKALHELMKQESKLKRVEGGWKFSATL